MKRVDEKPEHGKKNNNYKKKKDTRMKLELQALTILK
jgi:hypothetical protein